MAEPARAPRVPVDPPMTGKRDPNDPLVQMNVRVPQSLRDQIDARRDLKGLSRDRWVTNALSFLLQQTVPTAPYTGPGGTRTAIPPQRRPQPRNR